MQRVIQPPQIETLPSPSQTTTELRVLPGEGRLEGGSSTGGSASVTGAHRLRVSERATWHILRERGGQEEGAGWERPRV